MNVQIFQIKGISRMHEHLPNYLDQAGKKKRKEKGPCQSTQTIGIWSPYPLPDFGTRSNCILTLE